MGAISTNFCCASPCRDEGKLGKIQPRNKINEMVEDLKDKVTVETIFFLLWNRSYDMFWFMMANDMLYASWWFCNTDDPLRAVDLAIKDRDIMRVNQWIIEVGLFKNGGYSNLSMFCNKFLGWNRIIICNYQIWDNSISQMWIGTILVNILYINH